MVIPLVNSASLNVGGIKRTLYETIKNKQNNCNKKRYQNKDSNNNNNKCKPTPDF